MNTKNIEELILSEFKKRSNHLVRQKATKAMQKELLAIASPFHAKLKELGYSPALSRTMLKRAFDHNPPRSFRSMIGMGKINVFN